MSKRFQKSPEQIAEEVMPGWKAIRTRTRPGKVQSLDSVSTAEKAIKSVKAKYGFVSSQKVAAGKAASIPVKSAPKKKQGAATKLVRMKSARAVDSRVGRKVVVVARGKAIGIQG